jgi:tRNA 2-thiouridine synthesizing protein D
MLITIQVMVQPYTYEDLDTAIKIAEAALDKGHKVDIFLFCDSVLAINSKVKPIRMDRNIPKKLEDYRGVSQDAIIKGARSSGLPELAQLIVSSDRFINLMA